MPEGSKVTNWAKESISPEQLQQDFDAVLLTGGSEQSRDLPVPGRELDGIHFAMEFLPQQNKVNADGKLKGQLRADGKHVIVIGGGDTGSDCVGTSTRHGAASVTQFEVMPMPPEQENKPLVWPYWPLKLRTSSSHDESAEKGLLKREFAISTKEFIGKNGKLTGLKTVQVEMKDGKLVEVPGTEKEFQADLVLLAMGFVHPVASILDGFGIEKDGRGNAKATDALIGGGDTGSDCVGTSTRHGASSVTQFEVMPMPPEQENKPLVWPYWPLKLRTSSSHDESAEKGILKREFAISTKEFIGKNGKLTGLKTVHVEMKDGKLVEVPGTEKEYKADLVLLAMGFVNPVASILDGFGVEKDARGNAKATEALVGGYATSVPKVFAAGDMRRGQSLVVWAIREGRQAARAVDEFLMGSTQLPR